MSASDAMGSDVPVTTTETAPEIKVQEFTLSRLTAKSYGLLEGAFRARRREIIKAVGTDLKLSTSEIADRLQMAEIAGVSIDDVFRYVQTSDGYNEVFRLSLKQDNRLDELEAILGSMRPGNKLDRALVIAGLISEYPDAKAEPANPPIA